MKRLLSFLGYLAYALVLLVALLYVRFPGDKVLAYVEGRLAQQLPGSSWQVGKAESLFPWQLVVHDIRVRWPASERSLLLDRLVFDFSSLISQREVAMSGQLYGGSLEASLVFSAPVGTVSLSKVVLSGIDLARLTTDFKPAGRQVSGILTLTGDYSFTAAQPLEGTGSGKVEVTEGEVELLQPVLGLDRLPLARMTAALSYGNYRVVVGDGRLNSPLLTADCAGEVVLQSSPAQARVVLQGSMHPADALLARVPQDQRWVVEVARQRGQQAIPYRVGGTLMAPTILFFQ